eukprot:Pgem_evm1s19390
MLIPAPTFINLNYVLLLILIPLTLTSSQLSPDQLISKLVSNGPFNNNYDAFVIYDLEEINSIYTTTYSNKLVPMNPFTIGYNVTEATDKTIKPPVYWYYYYIHISVTKPKLAFNEDGTVTLTQTISPGSYYNQTTCYGPPLIPNKKATTNQIFFENSTFSITCSLRKIQSIVMGGLISLNLTDSTLNIAMPGLPPQFIKDFSEYWKN